MALKKVRPLYRVSTKGQLEDDDIPMQRNACVEFIKSKSDWILDNKSYIEKGVSGYKISAADRDVIQDVKRDAENGEFDVLLVFMFDRIGRKQYETPLIMKTLDKLGIELWSVKEGQQKFEDHSDDLINFIRFWQSSGESKKTSMRVDEDHKQMVLQGQFRGGQVPFGYRFEKSGLYNKKGKELLKLVIDEERSLVIKDMFNLVYEKGYGSNRIAQWLNDNGIKSSTNGKWNSGVVSYILRNPIYKGYMTYGKRRSDENGTFIMKSVNDWIISEKRDEEISIIDEHIWDKVQQIRTSRTPQKVKDKDAITIQVSKSPLLLVGRIFCGHCGSPLTTTYNTKPYKKADGTVVKYRKAKYRCSGKALAKTDCDGQTIYSQTKIEDTVLDEINVFLNQLKKVDLTSEINKKKNSKENKIEKEYEKLKSQKEKELKELQTLENEVTKSLLGESNFKPELLSSLIDKKQQSINKTKVKMVELEKSLNETKNNDKYMEKVKMYVPNWRETFDLMDYEKQKMIINYIVKNVIVRKDEITIDFDLDARQFIGILGSVSN